MKRYYCSTPGCGNEIATDDAIVQFLEQKQILCGSCRSKLKISVSENRSGKGIDKKIGSALIMLKQNEEKMKARKKAGITDQS